MSDLSVLKRVTLFLILLLSAVSMYAMEEDDDELLKLLPQSVTDVTQVETLRLRNRNLTELPESIGKLINLKRLYLSGNNLTELPESIGKLTNLIRLHLYENNLTELPESIGNLTSLKSLLLGDNNLMSLPESIGNLASLEDLRLANNNLTELPESIGNLTNLTRLDLQRNNLTELPKSIGNLVNLRSLNLSYTNLTTLPESIGNLTNLRSLVLAITPLKELPESFGNLSQLSSLNLVGTDLTPASLKPLQKLGKTKSLELNLRGLRLTYIPEISAYSENIDITFWPPPLPSGPGYSDVVIYATTAQLRVRSEWSLEGEILGVLDKGTEVRITGGVYEGPETADIDDKRAYWLHVTPVDEKNKLEGWVFGAYLEYKMILGYFDFKEYEKTR